MNILILYLEYLSNEQVSSAAGITGFESIPHRKPFKMSEEELDVDKLENQNKDNKQTRKIRRK